MEHVFWLIPSKLAGRPGPLVRPWNLVEIRSAGVTVVVSVDEDCFAESIRKAGLRHIPHFMPQAFPTNPALVDHFVGLVEEAAATVIAELAGGACVLVHCYAGRDRTGLVLCAVLMELEGLGAAEALARLKAVRPEALTGPGIVDVLREYEIRRKAR